MTNGTGNITAEDIRARLVPGGVQWECPRCQKQNKVRLKYGLNLIQLTCSNRECQEYVVLSFTVSQPARGAASHVVAVPVTFASPVPASPSHSLTEL